MFNQSVITLQGLELDAKIRAGSATAIFNRVELGDGTYTGAEVLEDAQALKNARQSIKISSILLTGEKTVRIRVVAGNAGITAGYYITEIGVYAQDPEVGEILYSVATGTVGNLDYQPSEDELSNSTSLFEYYIAVSNAKEATIQLGTGAAAAAADLLEKVDIEGGDISNTVLTTLEESAEEFPVPAAGESTKTFFGKVRKFIQDFNNFKTGILTIGMIVNNAVTDNSGLPVSAAVAKALQDQLTQLNSDLSVEVITSGTILDFYINNRDTHKNAFVLLTYFPSDSPAQVEGHIQFLRDSNGYRAVVLYYSYSLTNPGIWRRGIFQDAWREDTWTLL